MESRMATSTYEEINSTYEQFECIVPRRPESVTDWKRWCVAASSLLTVVLLFQPWLVASGPSGDVRVNAFGWMEGSLPGLDGFGYQPASYADTISDGWGMLAGVAAAVTISTAMLSLAMGIEALSRLIAVSGVATTVFVLAALLYLHGKAPELRDMTRHRDELTGLDDVLRTFVGATEGSSPEATQQAATAVLTTPALLCALAAVCTAVIALAGLRNRTRLVPVYELDAEFRSSEPESSSR
ncbi:hypothetical protein AB0B25_19260 [Nocardia sp. NPDC049190]|uniref:hypothetical protein n=1 Tax=Nocardia sp. NPDC049190 TaxID=3155650 RepID=UPI003411582B